MEKRKTNYKKIFLELVNNITITGEVNINRIEEEKEEEFYKRLSDMFTYDYQTPYLIVTNAKTTRPVESKQSIASAPAKILFVNKQNIIFAEPIEDE